MKMLGIWPEERKVNKISSYIVLISISFMALFIAIPQTINLFIIWGDLSMVVENLTLSNVIATIALFKTTAFWWNGENLKILLSCMEKNRREAKTPGEVKRMMDIAKICRTLSVASIIFSVLLLISAVCMRMWTNHYTGRALIVTSYSPYDHLKTPNFEVTMVCQITAGCYSVANYTMVDLFLATLLFHTCGQFGNLKEKFQSLYSKSDYGSLSVVAEIVKKHHSLCEFVKTIDQLFTYMLLMQMVGCTILLCIQSFQIIVIITGESLEMMVPQMIFFVSYIVYIMLQLYLYCYISEKLHSESMSMIEAAYDCKWYDLSPSEARSLIIIMIRARTPLCLTAGKICSLNHELFSSILKTSMSYLSVLYAMKTNDAG